ncbi:helix-turn-helix domain-containing protein [Alteribacillus sp. JSM 102045]|uniref:helix-turn-helix domain-containing protein n=1 Tax=Alteribacillus sp. JSM 102045 TaxID=1562101 RepID=UPI0035BFF19E
MIGERIVRYRMEKDITVIELAKKAGVSVSYLNKVEQNNWTCPSVQNLEKIAYALHISVHQLLGEKTAGEEAADLDEQWREVVMEAKESGVSKDRFKAFIKEKKKEKIRLLNKERNDKNLLFPGKNAGKEGFCLNCY